MSHYWTTKRSGVTLIYTVAAMVVFLGLASLAVDWARVQLVKTELQRAADAAAMYGAAAVADSANSARSNAVLAASDNMADNVPVVLTAADVLTGSWDADDRVFTANGTPRNAVKVSAVRSTDRANAVALTFAKIVGFSTFDVSAGAIAYATPTAGQYGNIILDGLNMNGNVKFDSWDSSVGTYAATRAADASIGGNFNFANANGNTKVEGSIFHTGSAPNIPVIGTTTKIDSLPSTPQSITPAGAMQMGNFNGGNLTLNSGNYYFQNFSANSGTITINAHNGPVRIYVNGAFSVSGSTYFAYSQAVRPKNFEIHMVASAGVDLNGNVDLYAVVNAPNSPMNINGTADFYGSVIVKQASLSGTGCIHHDTSLPKYGTGAGGVTLVR